MREGRIRPSLPTDGYTLRRRFTCLNEGGSNSTLVVFVSGSYQPSDSKPQ